jgi:hypothetical protein
MPATQTREEQEVIHATPEGQPKQSTNVSFQPGGAVYELAERHGTKPLEVDVTIEIRHYHSIDERTDRPFRLDCKSLSRRRAQTKGAVAEMMKALRDSAPSFEDDGQAPRE